MYCYNHSRFNYFPHPKYPTASQAWSWDHGSFIQDQESVRYSGVMSSFQEELGEAASLRRASMSAAHPGHNLETGPAKATYPVYPTPAAAGVQAALQEGPEATRGHCGSTWAVKIHTLLSQKGACCWSV